MAVYATVAEVRDYLESRLPGTVSDEQVQAWIDRATVAVDAVLTWAPYLDETGRPLDPDEARGLLVAAGLALSASGSLLSAAETRLRVFEALPGPIQSTVLGRAPLFVPADL